MSDSIIPTSMGNSGLMVQARLHQALLGPAAMVGLALELGSEMTRFWRNRIKAQAELIETLSQCRSGADIASTRKRFLDTATQQYSEEMKQFMGIAQKCIQTTADALVFPNSTDQTHMPHQA